jgi:hypothetical protein
MSLIICPHLERWTQIPLCSIGWALMTQCSTQSSHDPHALRVCINGMLCFGTRWKPPITRASTSTWVKLTPSFIGQTIQIVGILHNLFGRVPPTRCDLFAQLRNHCLTTSWVKLLGWWWPQNDGHDVPFPFPRMWIKVLQAILVVFNHVTNQTLHIVKEQWYRQWYRQRTVATDDGMD